MITINEGKQRWPNDYIAEDSTYVSTIIPILLWISGRIQKTEGMTFKTGLKTTNSKPLAPPTTTMTTPAAAGAGYITMKTVPDTFPK
jgi:hypothetical protein